MATQTHPHGDTPKVRQIKMDYLAKHLYVVIGPTLFHMDLSS